MLGISFIILFNLIFNVNSNLAESSANYSVTGLFRFSIVPASHQSLMITPTVSMIFKKYHTIYPIFVIIFVFIIIVDFVNVNVLSCLLPGKRVYSSYLESVVSSEPETYRDIRGLMERCQVSTFVHFSLGLVRFPDPLV